jgi:dehydrogenase/reductase SDR family protein 1
MTNDRERKEAPAGNVALVTGASRGVGRGIALGLLAAGFRVYGTGRSIDQADWAAQRHLGNTIYGIAKAATDKMTSDTAVELKPFDVPVISLYPGLVRTEAVLAAAKSGAFDLSTSESPEFSGRVINALFNDPNLISRTGQVLVAAAVAKEFGVLDTDGSSPPALTLADM